MILTKEFYFVRHGQTDHNSANLTTNQPKNMALNAVGKSQAYSIEPLIAKLPIQTVCSSPLKRAQQTAKILSLCLRVDLQIIDELMECSIQIWNEITCFKYSSFPPLEGQVRSFIDNVKNGIHQALSLPGPVLIVSHGGVHWVLCHLLSIEQHEWAIDNCIPVHFTCDASKKWTARKLI